MAPKTRGACVGAAGTKRKRTVKKPVREPTPSSSSSTTPAASPAQSTHEVDLLASRVITTGRKVDFELFENEGFQFGRQLIEMNLEKICSLDCPTYPALVKEFYKNLCRGDDGLVSTVRGIELRVTAVILSRLLDLPLSGPSTFTSEDRPPALSRLLNRNFEDFEDVYANQLPLELRLLHNICSRILFPKTGRFDYVSERDIFVMDCIVSGKPFNLPRMIIWYIADCGGKRKSSLPYGMILTQIFRSQGVLISDSEPKKELRHTDYYSLATIHRMGFIKRNGQWERRGQPEVRAADADAPGPSEIHISPDRARSPPIPVITPSPAPVPSTSDRVPDPEIPRSSVASSSAGFNDAQMDQLRSLLECQKESLEASFDNKFMSLKENLYSLEDRIAKIESTLSSATGSISTDLKNIFEELKDICGDGETYANCNAELKDKIITACTFVDEKLKDYVKVQCQGMQNIIDHLTRIVRKNF